jgi:hypothetical protein
MTDAPRAQQQPGPKMEIAGRTEQKQFSTLDDYTRLSEFFANAASDEEIMKFNGFNPKDVVSSWITKEELPKFERLMEIDEELAYMARPEWMIYDPKSKFNEARKNYTMIQLRKSVNSHIINMMYGPRLTGMVSQTATQPEKKGLLSKIFGR